MNVCRAIYSMPTSILQFLSAFLVPISIMEIMPARTAKNVMRVAFHVQDHYPPNARLVKYQYHTINPIRKSAYFATNRK